MLKVGDLVFVYGGLGYGIVTKTGHTYKILTFDNNKQAWYPNFMFKRVSE
jgi:hypothetical protein